MLLIKLPLFPMKLFLKRDFHFNCSYGKGTKRAKLHYLTSMGGAAVHLAGGLSQWLPPLTRRMAVARGCLGVKLHKRKSHTTALDQRPSSA